MRGIYLLDTTATAGHVHINIAQFLSSWTTEEGEDVNKT